MEEIEIYGYCPSCSYKSGFDYLGMQTNGLGKPVELYDCVLCENTLALESIVEYTKIKEIEEFRRFLNNETL